MAREFRVFMCSMGQITGLRGQQMDHYVQWFGRGVIPYAPETSGKNFDLVIKWCYFFPCIPITFTIQGHGIVERQVLVVECACMGDGCSPSQGGSLHFNQWYALQQSHFPFPISYTFLFFVMVLKYTTGMYEIYTFIHKPLNLLTASDSKCVRRYKD